MATARVFTIPASAPFLRTLIEALRDGRLIDGFPAASDPLAFAGATLYLPTRRACLLARDLFLDVTGAQSAILPRIVPIGGIDEDEIAFAQAAIPAQAALDLAPAIDGVERRLLLAELVRQWAASPALRTESHAPLVAGSPAAALALADDLARLMDDMATRQVPWERLDTLVPENLDEYWQLTLRFLKIAREHWPKLLAAHGAIEPAVRRDALIKAEAARLTAKADGPVIAAGSTGSIPATAELIAIIARLPHGAVVLPGLDLDLDEPTWARIAGSDDEPAAVGHPQIAMQALLKRIGLARDDVMALAPAAAGGRDKLVSEAFRPAIATDQWRQRLAEESFIAHAAAACESVSVIEAANPEEEALAIAITLRETAETPGQTAALVTPDRALARRVAAALLRWNIDADDSGGDALADTAAGVFARLAAEAGLGGLAPITLLALIKHPLLRLRGAPGAHTRAIAALERAVLRGPRPRPGTAGLASALAALRAELTKLRRHERSDLHASDPRTSLIEADLQAAANLVVELASALAPLEGLRDAPHAFADLVERHRQVVAMLSADASGMPAAFAGADGKVLAETFLELGASESAQRLRIALADFTELFGAAMSATVRRPGRPGMRVRILGLLEARLLPIDRVVLGGLNEGTWPPEARSDAWLSRPMRLDLGLDLPERRIALSAHDFAQLLGAREVFLTRAAKVAGAPTVASRFVQRLAAVAGDRWEEARQRGARYLDWARDFDRPPHPPQPVPRPEPTPPRIVRPTQLSVTEIEHWLRDPYSIYAKHILRLRPLDAVDTPPGAADRGTLIHGAIGQFTQAFAAALPPDSFAALVDFGTANFAALDDFPEARAFWWPRYLRIARWFADWEARRRAGVAAVQAEIRGVIEIPAGERTFRLSCRADRIERLADGSYAILDYKTGQVPTAPQVKSGLSPQLTLEGAILRGGRFEGIPAGASIAELVYIQIRGVEPAGRECVIQLKDSTPDDEADRALKELTRIVTQFEDEATPYRSRERPMFLRRFPGDYDHLARVKEWSLTGGAGDEMETPE